MKSIKYISIFIIFCSVMLSSCKKPESLKVYETSERGNHLTEINEFDIQKNKASIVLNPTEKYQKITGFGGAFTESSAYLLNKLSKEKRNKVIDAYFGDEGARYSLTRTHINSCDFSLSNYSYAEVEGDTQLDNFSIHHDKDDVIPMIKDAMKASKHGFKIISSPWTAPPWMKDNKAWKGGKLLPEYYDTWALFFSKYIEAYKKEGIDIWGITVENEPLGNGNNWESMHFTAEEMNKFVSSHLGPQFEKDGLDVKILGYDQNRDELEHWTNVMYKDEAAAKYFDGTAIHWYASTYDFFPGVLQHAHHLAPDKYLIQTEACVDAEVPAWKDDAWYWKKIATDWGWDWAPDKDKYLHPKYVPVFRYARDIIGCLNNWVDGWVDWNMVLDTGGGPNWANNWCVAPVIVDPDKDEIYFTPIYYIMSHFSRFIRPGAQRIGFTNNDKDLMVTALEDNNDMIVVILNQSAEFKSYTISLGAQSFDLSIDGKAIQTVVIPK